jgi:hypothetical protein
MPAWQFRSIDIHADGQAWTVSIPAVDLDLVLAAIAIANSDDTHQDLRL